VFDWGEFLQREFIWQKHWATAEKWRFYPKGNRVFLANKFLIQRGRYKNRIKKKYISDHHEFRDFWWKFHDFWISEAIEINSEEIKQIKWINQGLRFNQGLIWVQLGDRYTVGCKLGISNIHIQNQRRERGCHVSAPHWTTSTCGSHISDKWVPLMPRVSTSLVHLTQPMPRGIILFNPVRFPRDAWQALIGPHHRPHQHSCHLAAYEWSTAAREVPNDSTQRSHLNSICHVALSHWSKSPDRWAPP
jgi:hypothetical protein